MFKILAITYLSVKCYLNTSDPLQETVLWCKTQKPDTDLEHLKCAMETWFSHYKYQGYLQNSGWGLNVNVCIKFRGLGIQLSDSEPPPIRISSLSSAVNHIPIYSL